MKAMILAAGLGTRLRPLTNDRPKALVEVAGRTLLEIAIARLREFGVREVIVNVHHFGGMVAEYLREKNNFGMRVEISEEDTLLDTGGGLKKAAWFFCEQSPAAAPFILHNVDVISTIDLRRMLDFHAQNQALATLAVQQRQSSRYLLFDEQMRLCGRRLVKEQKTELVRPSPQLQEAAFSGIHVILPRLLTRMSEEGAFSIIQSYLRLAGEGERIVGYQAEGDYWCDLGKPESVARAAEDLKKRGHPSGRGYHKTPLGRTFAAGHA
jgi:NDP-sugar pyrophosphorylase family protein